MAASSSPESGRHHWFINFQPAEPLSSQALLDCSFCFLRNACWGDDQQPYSHLQSTPHAVPVLPRTMGQPQGPSTVAQSLAQAIQVVPAEGSDTILLWRGPR
jgi:hypothetical protein